MYSIEVNCGRLTIAALDSDIVEYLDAPVGTSLIRIDEHTFIKDDNEHAVCMTRREENQFWGQKKARIVGKPLLENGILTS